MNNGTIEVVLQAGAVGLLFVVLFGIGYLLVKGGPQVSAFLTGLINEQKAGQQALSTLASESRQATILLSGEIKAVTTTLTSEVRAVTARVELAEERLKGHAVVVAGGVEREVRDSATKTGEHVAITTEQALRELGRQPTNTDLEYGERPSPPPAGFSRPLLPAGRLTRPPSQPGVGPPQGLNRQRGGQ